MLLRARALMPALVGHQLPLPELESVEPGTRRAVPEYLSIAPAHSDGGPARPRPRRDRRHVGGLVR